MPVGPSPILAPFRLGLEYTVNTLVHTRHEFCDAVPDGTMPSGWAIKAWDTVNVDPSDMATAIANAAKALYPSSVTFGNWFLQQYLSGAYATVVSGAISVAGTGTGTVQDATQVALFWRDDNRVPIRLIFYETLFGVPFKIPSSTSNPALSPVFAGYSTTIGVHIGNYARSRGNARYRNALSFVGTDNRRLRKIRGLI